MYTKKAHIHFVGIGGIGMSGIAQILKYQGYTISGCDVDVSQKSIQDLKKIGALIYEGNNTPGCHSSAIDILVYSSAIVPGNPEITAAQTRGIPTIARAFMLAELMRTKYSVAIAGSHGKTTTTSLISHILIEAGLDPTVIIGGHLKNISANARLGKGDFLVAEADESDRSLLHLQATLAIVTNIDLEHLETYRNLEDIKETFRRFLNNLPFYGKAILCADDPVIKSLLPMPHIKTIQYGFSTNADVSAHNVKLLPDYSSFTVTQNKKKLGPIQLHMPGKHNVLNALGAITLALDLGISFKSIQQAISNFKGIERRFSFKGLYKGAEIFDDYGHHPKEIFHTLQVARNRSKGKLTVVFQPHRYTRTHKLWNQFIQIFMQSNVDHLIITDIYPASEKPINGITSENFVQSLKRQRPSFAVSYAPYQPHFSLIIKNLRTLCHENDLILLLGAGKINKLADILLK